MWVIAAWCHLFMSGSVPLVGSVSGGLWGEVMSRLEELEAGAAGASQDS
ncbi:hypothetical protein ACFFX0_10145 [Citricoccus parietis]|uniref:Uncharacterized protein n=1 Tax=Citricoccus parietis TaxID=592307 RepID=A0ABV5FY22_9MICC